MIGWLEGTVRDYAEPGKIVLDVHGVGYDVELSMLTYFQIQTQTGQAGLHIHTIVREDALILYGFLEKEERTLFRTLIKINSVGPRLAMNILSHTTPQDFMMHVAHANKDFLVKLPGVGKKTADRLLIELQGVCEASATLLRTDNAGVATSSAKAATDAVMALTSLGYKPLAAQQLVKKLDDGTRSSEMLIRAALKELSRNVALT